MRVDHDTEPVSELASDGGSSRVSQRGVGTGDVRVGVAVAGGGGAGEAQSPKQPPIRRGLPLRIAARRGRVIPLPISLYII